MSFHSGNIRQSRTERMVSDMRLEHRDHRLGQRVTAVSGEDCKMHGSQGKLQQSLSAVVTSTPLTP